MLRRILVGVYNNSNLIVLLWVVFSFVLTIKFNFESCIVENDLHNVFDILFYFMLIIIVIISSSNALLMRLNKKDMDSDNSSEMKNYEDVMSLGDYGNMYDDIDFNTLPLFLLIVFSLSKGIVLLIDFTTKDIIPLAILVLIFLLSFFPWKDRGMNWSFNIVLFGIIYIMLNLYWKELMPYLKDVINTLECVASQIKDVNI